MKRITTPSNIYSQNLADLESNHQKKSREIQKEISELEKQIYSIDEKIKQLITLKQSQLCDQKQYEKEYDAIVESQENRENEIQNIIASGIKEVGDKTEIEVRFFSEFMRSNEESVVDNCDIEVLIFYPENESKNETVSITGELITYPKKQSVEFNENHLTPLKNKVPKWQIKELTDLINAHYNNPNNWWENE